MRIGQIIAQWFHGIGVWLNRHSNIRMGLIVLSILFIIVSLVASDRLINKMAEEERVNMEIWANATQATSTNDISTTLIYLSRILESNPSIPTIITDQEGRIISYRNIDLPQKDAEAYLYEKLASFRNGYPPIVMEGLAEPQYLYYSDSHVLRQLHPPLPRGIHRRSGESQEVRPESYLGGAGSRDSAPARYSYLIPDGVEGVSGEHGYRGVHHQRDGEGYRASRCHRRPLPEDRLCPQSQAQGPTDRTC